MKVEFNNEHFSASMNDSAERREPPVSSKELVSAAQEHLCLVFGIMAFIGALLQIPYGFAASTFAEILMDLWEVTPLRLMVSVILICVILAAVAITLAILSLVMYAKHRDSKTAGIGRALAVIALVLCGVALVANMICFVLFLL